MGKIWLEYTEGRFQERNQGEQEKVKKEMEIFDNIDICIWIEREKEISDERQGDDVEFWRNSSGSLSSSSSSGPDVELEWPSSWRACVTFALT